MQECRVNRSVDRPRIPPLSLFPSTALCSPNPRVHATLAVCLASATATAAASGSSSSSNLKPREGASAAVALPPPAAVAAALPLFSLWREREEGGGTVIRAAGCVISNGSFTQPIPFSRSPCRSCGSGGRGRPNFESWERFSFGVVLLPPRQQQQIRRPQDR